MVAGALITQGTVDDHKIGWITQRVDLPGRSQADQHAAAAGKELFGNQDREWRPNCAANDASPFACKVKFVQLGVIARPFLGELRLSGPSQVANNIAIRVKNAD